jgi:hypothetical protein
MGQFGGGYPQHTEVVYIKIKTMSLRIRSWNHSYFVLYAACVPRRPWYSSTWVNSTRSPLAPGPSCWCLCSSPWEESFSKVTPGQLNKGTIAININTYLLTELSPSWEAANCAATQELPSIFKESEGSSPCSLVPILSHIDPVHTIPSSLSKI